MFLKGVVEVTIHLSYVYKLSCEYNIAWAEQQDRAYSSMLLCNGANIDVWV